MSDKRTTKYAIAGRASLFIRTRNFPYMLIDAILIFSLITSVIVFIAVPFGCVFKESFILNGTFDFSLLKAVLNDNVRLLQHSLSVGVCTTLLTALASAATAIFFFMSPKKLKTAVFFILAVSMISPPFVTALTYINLFGRRGLISYYLLGISQSPYGMTGIVLMQTLSDFSLGALILIGFLNTIDRFQLDSARNLGAHTNRLIVDIMLPQLFPALKAVMLLTFFRSISDFGTPAIIGGSFDVLATESYFAVIAHGNLGKASAINIVMLLPSLLVFFFYQRSIKNLQVAPHGITASESEIQRSGIVYYCISSIALFFLLWVSIQYGSIILSAFTQMKKGKLFFTLAHFGETVPHIRGTVGRTILYSFIAAMGGSILGLLIAYYKHIRGLYSMKCIDFIASLPYIIPGTFLGLGYLLAFNAKPLMLTGTAAIVILNILFKQLPFSTKVGAAAMEDIRLDILQSIRDLGGSRFHEVTDAVIPLSRHALGLSFINGFTSTMTTIGSIIFLVYPGQKVLTLVMFDVIQSGYYEIGSVIALMIIAICAAVNIAYQLLERKYRCI